jgi:hypothetical protein
MATFSDTFQKGFTMNGSLSFQSFMDIINGAKGSGSPGSALLQDLLKNFNGLTSQLNGSNLLNYLWNQYSGPIKENTLGAGTYYGPDTTTGGSAIFIDPAQLPGAAPINGVSYALKDYAQLAAVVGHELSHAVLPNANVSYVTGASSPDDAVAIGERDEGIAYTAEYIIAEQLAKTQSGADAPDVSTIRYRARCLRR